MMRPRTLALALSVPVLAQGTAPVERFSGADACRARHARAESREPSRASSNIDVHSYTIDIALDFAGSWMTARCDVGLESVQAGTTSFSLDLAGANLTVTSVLENGTTPVTFSRAGNQLTISPATPMALGEQRTFAISYNGRPSRGLYYDPDNGAIAFTFAEPNDARYWFPCRDMPSDKADWYHGIITAPTAYQVASNGDLQGVVDNGNGTQTWTYFHDVPVATYLISIAVSNYQTFTQAGPVPLKHFVYPSHFTEAQADFARVPDMITFLGTKYWPFGFPTYGMAIAPMGGAMEHQTMTTMDPGFITGTGISDDVIAHELSHQWWGDLVTCEDFKNIWLNEGFASYFDPLFFESYYGNAAFLGRMRDNRFSYLTYEPFEGRFSTYDPSYLWGVTVYEKGSWILHMLRHQLSDATFTSIMTEWARAHAYGNGNSAQFQANAETVSGTSLQVFFDQWLYKAGYPELELTWSAAGGNAIVRIDQVQQVTTITPLFDVMLDLQIVTPSGNVSTTVHVDRKSQSFTIPVPAPPSRIFMDPGVNLLFKAVGLDGVLAGPGPAPSNAPQVQGFSATGAAITPLVVPYGGTGYGANVGAGNLDSEALDEIVTGPGPGAVYGPHVRAFKVDGTPVAKVSYYAYGTLRYGVLAAGGGVDGDAYDEILTGPGPGAVFGPHVRGWNVDGGSVQAIPGISFYAYSTLKYGVNPASGSVDADAYAEILTGAGPGAVFGPHVRGFDFDGAGPVTPIAKVSFLAFPTASYGVNVASGDLDGDGMGELLAGKGPGPTFDSEVRGFDYDGVAITAIAAVDRIIFNTLYGAEVGSTDEDGDGVAGVVAAPGPDPQAPAFVYLGRMDPSGSLEDTLGFLAFGSATHGANVAGGRFTKLGISPLAPPQAIADRALPARVLRGIAAPYGVVAATQVER